MGLILTSGGMIIFLMGLGFVMFLIFCIPAYFILKVILRKPAWNREIDQIAGERGFTHQQSAPLPDYIRAANFPIFSSGRVHNADRSFALWGSSVTHLLHGFMGNTEVTVFYYTFTESHRGYAAVRRMGTAIAFRNNGQGIPTLYKKESSDYLDPQYLRKFIDEHYQLYQQSLMGSR